MDNFRRRPVRGARRTMDIMNAPGQGPISSLPSPDRQRARIDGLRTSGRRLDDFSRPDGYHTSQPNVKTTEPLSAPMNRAKPMPHHPQHHQATRQQQASLLNMTLPGGTIDDERKKGAKQKERVKHSKWRAIRKWTFRTAIAGLILVLLTGGFLAAKGYLKIHKVFKGGGTAAALQAEVKPELLKGEGDGRVNILLLGKGGDGHDGPDLTDTILVASIDPVNKNASLVSLPRDLWVTPSGSSSSAKINATYANAKYRALNQNPKNPAAAEQAGITAIEQMATQVLGIPINYYMLVDFQAFRQAVDAVGGVDINVPANLAVSEHMWDETNHRNYFLDVPAGQQHFDGTRALFFSRTRHTSARGDFDRTERQRLFITALSQKILSAGTYTNPVKISQLMSAFGDHISTDFSVKDALRLMTISKGIGNDKVISVGLADPPNSYVRTDNINGLSVVRPTAGVGDYSQIQAYIRNTLKDPYISKENAKILILNGTSSIGLAGAKSDQLKSYGYNIIGVADAPTSAYTTTKLVDMTSGKKPFTQHYLENRFHIKATTKLPDTTIQTQGADFVLILGQDETSNSQN